MPAVAATLLGAITVMTPRVATAADEPMHSAPTASGTFEVAVTGQRVAQETSASISPLLDLDIRVRPSLGLHVATGVAIIRTQKAEGGLHAASTAANFALGARYVREPTARRYRHLSVGVDIALPTATRRRAPGLSPSEFAMRSRGAWSPWLWQPGDLGVVVPLRFRRQVARRVLVGADAAVGALIGVRDSDDRFALAAQAAVNAAYLLPWFAAGLAVSGVHNGRFEVEQAVDRASTRLGDKAQFAVAPFIDVGFCKRKTGRALRGVAGPSADCPASLMTRVNINLDPPYGFSRSLQDSQSVWGVIVGLGWAL